MADIKDSLRNISDEIIEETMDEVEELKEELEEALEEVENLKKPQKTTLGMIVVSATMFILCVSLLVASFSIKNKSAKKAYDESKKQASDIAYNETGKKIFDIGEERYHTSNEFSIAIDKINAESSLHVLDVTESHCYIHDGDKEIKSEVWYKFIGTGSFSVNMNRAEIIVDEERAYIFIRIPEPTLDDNFKLITQQVHFKSNIFENVSHGEKIASKAEKESLAVIKQQILSNQTYLECAKNSAKELLIDLAKESNPDVEVEVEVNFF